MARCQHSRYGWCDDCRMPERLEQLQTDLDAANAEIAELKEARKLTPEQMDEPYMESK